METPSVLRAIASIGGLWAIAVAQPLFDVLGRAPEFFVAHKAERLDVVILAVALVLAGPVVLAAVVAVGRAIGVRAFDVVAACVIGVLAGIVAAQAGYRFGISGWTGTALVALVAASLVSLSWLRVRAVRMFLLVLSPAMVIVPLMFLLTGPLQALAQPDDERSGSAAAIGATPVVIVVFDELSLVSLLNERGEINSIRYPHLAALAADSVWFRNATTVSDQTRFALPAILTGRYPLARSAPTPRDHPNTLFSLLGRTHRLEVSEPITSICPQRLCAGSDNGRADRLASIAADLEVIGAHVFLPPVEREGWPSLTDNWAGFLAEDTDDDPDPEAANRPRPSRSRWARLWRGSATSDLTTATQFIDGISPEDPRPTLYFMHTMVTHSPARWLPSGQRIANRQTPPGLKDGTWTGDEWMVAQHHQLHLMQAALADELVGRLRTRLTQAGLYDQALVLITADHGRSFRAGHRMRRFDGENDGDLMSVPLIVKLPDALGQDRRGTTDDSNVETTDILPTVAGILGAGITWPVDGRSLLDVAPPRQDKRIFEGLATSDRRVNPAALRHSRDRAVTRQSALFGDDAWPVFTLPELRPLIGREVASFGRIDDSDDIRLVLDDPAAFEAVDPSSEGLPVQVIGRMRGRQGVETEPLIAVALNGRIVATTRRWPGSATWMAMLPPAALRQGANEVEAFLVDPRRPDRLRRTR